MYRMGQSVVVAPLSIVSVCSHVFHHGGSAYWVVQVSWPFPPFWILCFDRVVVGAVYPHPFVLAFPPSAVWLLLVFRLCSLRYRRIVVPSLPQYRVGLLLPTPASLPLVLPVLRGSELFVVWLCP